MIGPSLPAHLVSQKQEDDSDSDDYSPALPPGFTRPQQGPSLPSTSAAMEPASPQSSDSSDDDEVGPLPAPSHGPAVQDGVQEFLEREARLEKRKREEEDEKNAKPKRADWMIVPRLSPTPALLIEITLMLYCLRTAKDNDLLSSTLFHKSI